MQHAYPSHSTSVKSFKDKTGWDELFTAQRAEIIRVRNGMTCVWTFLWWSCALWLRYCCILVEHVETCPVSATHSHSVCVPRHILCNFARDFPYVEKLWICAWNYWNVSSVWNKAGSWWAHEIVEYFKLDVTSCGHKSILFL